MTVIVVMGNKNKQKNAYGEKLSIGTNKLKNQINGLTEEERNDLILNSHDGTFVTPEGEDLKYTLINLSWDSIKDNPLIPAEVRRYWASLPVESRAKSISQYKTAMNKLQEYIYNAAAVAATLGKAPGDGKRYMESIMPVFVNVANNIAEQIMTGAPDVADPMLMNATITAGMNTAIASIDQNADEYQFFKKVMGKQDPLTGVWVNC